MRVKIKSAYENYPQGQKTKRMREVFLFEIEDEIGIISPKIKEFDGKDFQLTLYENSLEIQEVDDNGNEMRVLIMPGNKILFVERIFEKLEASDEEKNIGRRNV